MSIVVTGATGHLGRHVVEQLLEKVPAEQITAVVRDEAKAADFAARGVKLAIADYNAPETFDGLFAAGDKVLLISGNEFDKGRPAQHQVVIDAAKAAGVALLAYTSAPGTLTAALADDHRATEEALRASGVPYVLLRNSWYHENYTAQLPAFLASKQTAGIGQEGRISAAGRSDYAAAAVRVLTTDGHAGQAYELGGDEPFTLAQLAAEISAQSGKEVRYVDLPEAEYAKGLKEHGVPELMADMIAETDAAAAHGTLYTASGHLTALTGRSATTLSDAVGAALRALDKN